MGEEIEQNIIKEDETSKTDKEKYKEFIKNKYVKM
jgi:hypothetical protein